MQEVHKLAKELHVTGFNGTSFHEVFLTLNLAVPIGYLLWKISPASRSTTVNFCKDFAFIAVPCLISITTVDWQLPYSIGLLSACIAMRYQSDESKPARKDTASKLETFLSAQRSITGIMTATAILAVDFHVMPRRFIKCETFGQSIMDIGTVAFVFLSSLPAGPRFALTTRETSSKQINSTLVAMLPVLVMGIGRGVVLRMLNYQHHVAEYGIHWNFFVTLSLLPLFMIIHKVFLAKLPFLILAMAILLGYQYGLSNYGLEDYILHAERTNLIAMNREGIFSLLGFFSIYLVGADLGCRILISTPKDISENEFQLSRLLTLLAYVAGLACANMIFIGILEIPVSRRTTNISFVLFYLFLMVSNLTIHFLIEYFLIPISARGEIPDMLAGISKYQLAFFLVANLLTGAVNFGFDTLEISDEYALVILVGYLGILALFSVIMFKKGIKVF